MKLKKLPYTLTVCKLETVEQIDLNAGFYFIGKTDEELSLVCRTESTQIAVLGTGDPAYENLYKELEARHPGRFAARILFSEELSRRMYAGADIGTGRRLAGLPD